MTILIFEERYRGFLKKIDNNLFPIKKFLPLGELIEKQELILNEDSHIVTLGGDKLIREVSVISLKSKFQMSIGIVYVSDSKLINIFSIPKNFEESLKVAFEKKYISS